MLIKEVLKQTSSELIRPSSPTSRKMDGKIIHLRIKIQHEKCK